MSQIAETRIAGGLIISFVVWLKLVGKFNGTFLETVCVCQYPTRSYLWDCGAAVPTAVVFVSPDICILRSNIENYV